MKFTKILYMIVILNFTNSIFKHINNNLIELSENHFNYSGKKNTEIKKFLLKKENLKIKIKEDNFFEKIKNILEKFPSKKNLSKINKKTNLFNEVKYFLKNINLKEKNSKLINKKYNLFNKVKNILKKIRFSKEGLKLTKKSTNNLSSKKIIIDYLFINNIITLILDIIDFKLNIGSLKSQIEQFEINLNYLILQDLFKIKDEEVKKIEESDFEININPAFHQKDISLFSGDCFKEENKNYNCLRIPLNIFINKNQGHFYNYFLNIEFYFQDTINFSRILVNELSMTTDEDYRDDSLIKIDKMLETINEVLFYNSGPLNIVFTGLFDSFFRFIRVFCDEFRMKGDGDRFVFNCDNEI